MATIDNVKNRLIDKILATQNQHFLEAIENIFVLTQKEEIVTLNSEQIEMLAMSEIDIEAWNLISELELDKMDKQWLG